MPERQALWGATITAATMTLNIVSGTSTANAARAYQVTGGEANIVAQHIHNGVLHETLYMVYVAEEDEPVFRIKHYYDAGYNIREGNANAAIQSYQNAVTDKFKELFGVTIISSIYNYTSICDECVLDQSHELTSDALETLCRHPVCCATTDQLRSDLFSRINYGDDTSTVVIWSGRKMNAYESNRSNSDSSTHTVVITTYGIADWNALEPEYGPPIDTAAIYAKRTDTLFHELSHQLGAPDHYCYEDYVDGICSNPHCDACAYGYTSIRACMMSGGTSITDQVVYCDDCFNTISEHIEDHHYPLSN